MQGETGVFLSGYDNVYNDSPYDQGYLDALCMLDQFNVWNEQESNALKEAKQLLTFCQDQLMDWEKKMNDVIHN